jgi:hypothetical protein
MIGYLLSFLRIAAFKWPKAVILNDCSFEDDLIMSLYSLYENEKW